MERNNYIANSNNKNGVEYNKKNNEREDSTSSENQINNNKEDNIVITYETDFNKDNNFKIKHDKNKQKLYLSNFSIDNYIVYRKIEFNEDLTKDEKNLKIYGKSRPNTKRKIDDKRY